MQGSEELFFVAARDGSGRHVFTTNLDDHLAAKRRADVLVAKRRTADKSSEDLAPPVPKSKSKVQGRARAGD
jgi:hypothetical protein